MRPFSRERQPRRDRMIPLRVSEEEAQGVDDLAARLGLETRADVLRAALDFLAAHHPALKGGRQGGRSPGAAGSKGRP